MSQPICSDGDTPDSTESGKGHREASNLASLPGDEIRLRLAQADRKAVHTEFGPNFNCETCDVAVQP